MSKEDILKDPNTIHMIVSGVDIVYNKEHNYIATMSPDVTKETFVGVIQYLIDEGFVYS